MRAEGKMVYRVPAKAAVFGGEGCPLWSRSVFAPGAVCDALLSQITRFVRFGVVPLAIATSILSAPTISLATAITGPEDRLYWVDRLGVSPSGRIMHAGLDGSDKRVIARDPEGAPTGIAVDPVDRQVYWASEVGIKTFIPGSGIQTLVSLPGFPEHPIEIEIDPVRRKMYWTDENANTISRADLDGSNLEIVISGGESLEGIAIDVNGEKLYWSDLGADQILRSHLDGSSLETLVSTGVGPTGIALDIPNSKIYWAEIFPTNRKIRRADLDGGNIEDVVVRPSTSGGSFLGLAFDLANSKVYFSSLDSTIERSDLDGSNIEIVIADANARYIAIGPPIPEPSTGLLLALGLLGLGVKPNRPSNLKGIEAAETPRGRLTRRANLRGALPLPPNSARGAYPRAASEGRERLGPQLSRY